MNAQRAFRASAAIVCLLALWPAAARAQAAAPTLTFSAYLELVLAQNRDLAAARADIRAADAGIQIGARLPDPQLLFGILSFDVSHPTRTEHRTDPGGSVCPQGGTQASPIYIPCILSLPVIVGGYLDIPIELGNQQGGRMDLARVGAWQARSTADDTIRTVRGQAADAWITSLAAELDLARLQHTLENVQQLVAINDARVHQGAANEIELVQSRVEAQMFRAQVLVAQGEEQASITGLMALLGTELESTPEFDPVGDLSIEPRQFRLSALLEQAAANRPDLRAIQLDIDAGRRARVLAERQRWGQLDVITYAQYSAHGEDTQYGQGDYFVMGLALSYPLPFRLLWNGEVDQAQAQENAAEERYAQAMRRLSVEVEQGLERYEAAVQARALFDSSVVSDAEQVLAATRIQYQQGAATLVQVLVAQRTLNEVYAAWYSALAAHATALADLETSVGIWDIDFGHDTDRP